MKSGPGEVIEVNLPELFRRDDVPEKGWVAFAYGPAESRQVGFITYEALAILSLDLTSPETMFDSEREAILGLAVDKVKRGEIDEAGRVLITEDDVAYGGERPGGH